jgi:gas vesicle protein
MRNRQPDIESVTAPYQRADDDRGTEEPVPNDKAFDLTSLLVGFGIGVGLAILFAPQSGDETRQWISASAEDGFRQLRRRGRRLVFEAQDLLDRGEYGVNRALRTGKNVLESVASKLE